MGRLSRIPALRRYVRLRPPLRDAPANFNRYSEKPGGDQVFARRYSNGAWGPPIPISEPGGDMWRPAIAVDGSGRAWVFWSATRAPQVSPTTISTSGPCKAPRPAKPCNSPANPDRTSILPLPPIRTAAYGLPGRPGAGRGTILSVRQDGEQFSQPAVVASSNANEWNPAIAADRNGRVSVAWDSYRNGSYDVYLRSATSPSQGTPAWGKEVPVAASARYEAYPSIAYDPSGCLWIAYEEGAEGWGKDFGA